MQRLTPILVVGRPDLRFQLRPFGNIWPSLTVRDTFAQYCQFLSFLTILRTAAFYVIIMSIMKNIEKTEQNPQLFKITKILQKDFVINTKEAAEILGNRREVYRLADRGDLIYLEDGRNLGLFTLPSTTEEEASFAAISKYYPDCVVSGKTCLSLHGLSDDYIGPIDVDIPYPMNLKNRLLKAHRIQPEKINGVITRKFEDRNIKTPIKIYTPERALHEANKYYGRTDAFYRAIKRYENNFLNRKEPGEQYDQILSFGKTTGQQLIQFFALGDLFE